MHTVYLLAIHPEFTILQAFIAGPNASHLLFRTLLLTGGIALGLKTFQNPKTPRIDEYIKLKKAVDTSGEVIFITDRNGCFTYVNPEFTNVYGFAADEIVGKKTPRIFKKQCDEPGKLPQILAAYFAKEGYHGRNHQ